MGILKITWYIDYSLFQHFNADRFGEPPEEDPSPGAVESDMMLTDEQKSALKESKAKGTNTMTKRKGLANTLRIWPNNTIPYVISQTAGE